MIIFSFPRGPQPDNDSANDCFFFLINQPFISSSQKSFLSFLQLSCVKQHLTNVIFFIFVVASLVLQQCLVLKEIHCSFINQAGQRETVEGRLTFASDRITSENIGFIPGFKINSYFWPSLFFLFVSRCHICITSQYY